MRISGEHRLPVPRDRVWDALLDPAVLARTLPGCRALEVTGEDAYAATVTAGVGSVRGTYRGRVALTDKQAPTTYRLRAEGAGGPGTIRADATVVLDEHAEGTTIRYDADAEVGGVLGGVGQRMLAGVATRTAGEFFSAVERELVHGPAAVPAPSAGPSGVAPHAGGPVAADGAEPQLGQVFHGAPPAPAGAGGRRALELLAAVVLGAVIALVGVAVGRRTPRTPRR